MKILVEGADCSGKTTLVQALQKTTGWDSVHHTQYTNSIPEFLNTVGRPDPVIIDRLWISEQIYGYVMRGGSNDSRGQVFTKMQLTSHLLVMCVRSDINKHIQHFVEMAKHRQEYPNVEQICQVIEAYHDLFYGNKKSKFLGLVGTLTRLSPIKDRRNVIHYDMDLQSADTMAEIIKRKLQC